MTWVEIAIEIHREAIEAVSNLLQDAGANGTVIEDPEVYNVEGRHGEIRPPDLFGAGTRVKAYLPENDMVGEKVEFIRKQLDMFRQYLDVGPGGITLRPVRDEEWAESWKKYYKTQRVGRRLVVVPSWEHPDDNDNADSLVVYLDPGMAFGTGTHPTTRRCLQTIEDHIRGGEFVYDVGTGSGILSIAAAKLGAGRVVAIDLDPVAVRIARENVSLNHVENIVTVREGDLLSVCSEPAQLILANIIADAVIMLADSVPERLAPGGLFVAGGIIDDRRDETLRAIVDAGLRIREIHQDGEWVSVLAMRG